MSLDDSADSEAAGRKPKKKKKKTQKLESGTVLRQLLLNYLAEESRTDRSCHYARKFLLSQWCSEEQGMAANAGTSSSFDASFESKIYAAQWDSPLSTAASASLPREATIRISRKLAARRAFAQSFDVILSAVLRAYSEQQASLRARAVKSLAEIVDAEPTILSEERAREAVRAMLLDTSIAVRQNAVELVGRHILKAGQTPITPLRSYYEAIADRVLDAGISVRKQAVKILREICLSPEVTATDAPLVADACRRLVGRVSDEESVRNIVL
jgi:cohesin loading factor subunit SCC2